MESWWWQRCLLSRCWFVRWIFHETDSCSSDNDSTEQSLRIVIDCEGDSGVSTSMNRERWHGSDNYVCVWEMLRGNEANDPRERITKVDPSLTAIRDVMKDPDLDAEYKPPAFFLLFLSWPLMKTVRDKTVLELQRYANQVTSGYFFLHYNNWKIFKIKL